MSSAERHLALPDSASHLLKFLPRAFRPSGKRTQGFRQILTPSLFQIWKEGSNLQSFIHECLDLLKEFIPLGDRLPAMMTEKLGVLRHKPRAVAPFSPQSVTTVENCRILLLFWLCFQQLLNLPRRHNRHKLRAPQIGTERKRGRTSGVRRAAIPKRKILSSYFLRGRRKRLERNTKRGNAHAFLCQVSPFAKFPTFRKTIALQQCKDDKASEGGGRIAPLKGVRAASVLGLWHVPQPSASTRACARRECTMPRERA